MSLRRLANTLFRMVSVVRPLSPTASLGSSPVSKKQKRDQRRDPGPESRVREVTDEEAAPILARVREAMAQPFETEKKYAYELEYNSKLVLAPMVRTGTLPTRLLSLYYGAGLVWSPEIVDRAIIGAKRVVDPETGVITYTKGQGPIFSTHPVEKPFLIFQLGTSNPRLAAAAAKVVAQDVSGFDLNCGCPKPFSTHAGMGAALLSTPDLLLDILRKLINDLPLPVSCKIRILQTRPETQLLAARIMATGIRNLSVHARTRDMRPREAAIWDRVKDVVDLGKERGINVILNGDGEGYENWRAMCEATGATSAMLGRSAERNPSVFAEEVVDAAAVIVPLLLYIGEWSENPWGNTKFLLTQFKPSAAPIGKLNKQQRKEFNAVIARAKSFDEVAEGVRAAGIEIDMLNAKEHGKRLCKDLEERLSQRPEWKRFKECEAARDAAIAELQPQWDVEIAEIEKEREEKKAREIEEKKAAAEAAKAKKDETPKDAPKPDEEEQAALNGTTPAEVVKA